MNIPSLEEKLERNQAFWEGAPLKRPLISVHTGDHFFSRQFKANHSLLQKRHIVTPDQIHVADYLADYLKMYEESTQIDQDAIFTVEPCTGFPWMEAIFGATVLGAEAAFITEPVKSSVEELQGLSYDKQNPWYLKYLEFSEMLQAAAKGRFTVGQPILRGVTDTIGAVVGQEEMICGLLEEPELVCDAFQVAVKAHRDLIADQMKITEPFHGGYSVGFYNIWAPGSVIWFQEDLAALMAPYHHKMFLRGSSQDVIAGYDYSLVHLHPASFAHLESILENEGLKAVQINKDVAGPSIRDMIPQCKQVLESGKKLVLGMGVLDQDDIDAIYENLPPHSTAITMLSSTVSEANSLIAYSNEKTYR